jgi:hypothetical protein
VDRDDPSSPLRFARGLRAATRVVLTAVVAAASWLPAAADDLGTARLLIAGTRLTVSPASQTVPFGTPTIVQTALEGYDAGAGVLPADLRVRADFTGPEIDGVLLLEAIPGQPLRIPRLSLEGQYRLDNIRLVEGDELLAFAEPRSAAVLVTQVLVTRVTSRPLTLDEIRSYGIVVDDENFDAFNFTFGFAVDGEVIDYNVPVLFSPLSGEPTRILAPRPGLGGSSGTTSARFKPPQLAPFTLQIDTGSSGGPRPTGGCLDPFGCEGAAPVSLPGVILFPADVGLLHQFFSVVLLARNDAPAGDPLVIRDLAARVTLPPGLRPARTEPPTPLGVPVPVWVPGPDGELGTVDDVTFLVAQSTGQAEVLVEGLKQGTHVVEFDLDGTLEGLPGGLQRITGRARGAVVVRDPALGVTITHPDTVRVDEEYTLRLTVANTSNAPVNLVTVALPASGLSGVSLLGPGEATIPSLPPGESELIEFRLLSQRTGRVTATSARSPSQIDPRFELTVGVGENGIPLSPDSVVLPRSTEKLPPDLVRNALAMVGLGLSLATAPPSLLDATLPRIDRGRLDEKVYWLAQAGRHVGLGEETVDSAAILAAEWCGARDADWEWDRLRRSTDKGGKVGASVAALLAAEAAATTPRAAAERFASTTAFLGPFHLALGTGAGATVEMSSRTTGEAVAGSGLDPLRRRELPFADLYDLGDAEMAFAAVAEEGGYRVRLRAAGGGTVGLLLVVPDAAGGPARTVRWDGVALGAGDRGRLRSGRRRRRGGGSAHRPDRAGATCAACTAAARGRGGRGRRAAADGPPVGGTRRRSGRCGR